MTWSDSSFTDNFILKNFYRKDRTTRGGGALFAGKNIYKRLRLIDFESENV
jgi:hypothetical protein